MSTSESKVCSKCGEQKPLDCFHRHGSGHVGHCKDCKRAYDRKRRDEQGEELLQKRRDWYWRNREENLAYQAEWREANKDLKQASDRQWREANVERKAANDAAWREANRDKISAYFRDLHKRRPERAQLARAKRRAAKKAVLHEPWTRREIYDRDGGDCKICGAPLPYAPHAFHIDHIVPISLGGPDIPANLQLACPGCNLEKRARLDGQIHLPV